MHCEVFGLGVGFSILKVFVFNPSHLSLFGVDFDVNLRAIQTTHFESDFRRIKHLSLEST